LLCGSQALAKITPDGVFLEELERDPAHLPAGGDRRTTSTTMWLRST
jgi:hypothetical protein